MRVLLLTQVLPYPPDSGPKVKTWNTLKYLSSRHDVTLISFVRGDQSADARRLEQHCRAVHTVPLTRGALRDAVALTRSLWRGTPFLMDRDERRRMRRVVRRITDTEPFDVVHADQLNMASYALDVARTPRLLDAHNALWTVCKRLWEYMDAGPRRWMLGREWRLLKQYEKHICGAFDAVLAVSPQDRASLEEAIGAPADITVIPIAIDTHETTPVTRRGDAGRIVYIGSLLWPPNVDGVVWFARTVLPIIRGRRPNVAFDIVGATPPADVSALAQTQSGITVAGYVANPTAILERAGVMVVPVRAGGGMRVKILTAFAQEIPVVSTTLGCEGIDATAGEHLLIADEAEPFADAVVRVLESPTLAAQLTHNGRRLVAERYDYREACRPLDAVYERLSQHQRRQCAPQGERRGEGA